MRIRWVPVLVIFSVYAFSASLTIGTFNCEFLSRQKVHVKFGYPLELEGTAWADRWADDRFRQDMFDRAAAAVAKTIAEMRLDVAVLTEVGPDADVLRLQELLKQSGDEFPFVVTCRSQEKPSPSGFVTGQHVAILSKKPVEVVSLFLPGTESYDAETDDSDRELRTGIDKGLHVVIHEGSMDLHVFGVHLQSERGGFDNDERRVAQASIVRRLTLPFLRSGAFVVVAGDLNDGRGQPAIRRIRGRDDIDTDLVQTGFKEFFPPDQWNQRWTYEFEGVRSQIDHILLSPNLASRCTIQSRVHPIEIDVWPTPQSDACRVSDHRALIVTLTWK